MNVLARLTWRNLKLNRKRTIVTIIGIILSGAMICGVAALVASFQDFMIRGTEMTEGKHHATFQDVPYENSNLIANHVGTRTAMLSRDAGFARLEGSQNTSKPYLMIKQYDSTAMEHFPLTLAQGRFPERDGEIVLSEEVLYNAGVDIAIGDTLTLDIGRRIDQGTVLDQEILSETETLEILETKTYTVTGFIERPPFEMYGSPGYTAIAYLDASQLQPDERVNVSIIAENPRKIFDLAPKLAESAGAEGIWFNQELLGWMGIFREGSRFGNMFENIGLIIILLIVVGSVSVIYNAFAISVSERKKQFGMLSSVGATKRQIRRMVFLEGLILALIAIPVGIVSGIAGIGVTLQVVNDLMEDSFFDSGLALRLVVLPETVWISVCFIALTIFISAWVPAVRASRITPIEAIRLTTDIQVKGKHLRTSKLTRRLFGIEGELALKNLKRHRKRYRATVFSLVISIVLYVSSSSFIKYGFVSSDMYYNEIEFDIAVEKQQIPVEEQLAFYEQVARLEAVERYSVVRTLYHEWKNLDSSQFSRYVVENVLEADNKEEAGPIFEDPDGGYRIGVNLVAVGSEEFAAYTRKLGLDPEEYRDTEHIKGILVNWNKIQYPVMAEFEPLNVKAGDKAVLSDYAYEDNGEPYRYTIEIGAVTDQLPFAVYPGGLGNVNIIVSDEVFQHVIGQLHLQTRENSDFAQMFIQVKEGTDRKALVDQIETIDAQMNPGSYLLVEDTVAMKEELNRIRTVISIFLYGFVILIALIGVTNIFNTISTNVALRRREFAMLKSVGLTPAGFNRMINYESIFYGLKGLLYGLPISILISIWQFASLGGAFRFEFRLPWKEIGVCVAAVFLIVFATMLHASSKLKKENIIDALKEENL